MPVKKMRVTVDYNGERRFLEIGPDGIDLAGFSGYVDFVDLGEMSEWLRHMADGLDDILLKAAKGEW